MTDKENNTGGGEVKKSSGTLWLVIVLAALAGVGAYVFMQEQVVPVSSVDVIDPVAVSSEYIAEEPAVEIVVESIEQEVFEELQATELFAEDASEDVIVEDSSEDVADDAIEEMAEEELAVEEVPVIEPVIEAVIEEGPATLELEDMKGSLTLSSSAFYGDLKRLPLTHTCHRSNTSPAVAWDNVPEGTQSFVLFMEQRKVDADPYVYWVLFNIPGDKRELPSALPKQGELADGTRYARNDHGVSDYAGPCDPRGRTDSVFRLFAIDIVLEEEVDVDKDDLIRAMNGHILDTAEFDFHHILRP